MSNDKMTDREMLVLVYGAIKVTPNAPKEIVKLVEDHLFGPPNVHDFTITRRPPAPLPPSSDGR